MSVAAAEAHEFPFSEEPREWTLRDREGTDHKFTGWLRAEKSTEHPASRQWTEMQVYKTIGGNYVLYVLGCSAVYHRYNSECNTGVPTLASDMEADLVPCGKCQPLSYLRVDLQNRYFNVEVNIPTYREAATPEKLIRYMRMKDGTDTGQLSFVASRLLRELRDNDPDVDRELSKPKRLA